MPEQTTDPAHRSRLPGLDAEATPVIGVGLGLTGILLGLRPRLAAWPLALTALAALFYRDPERKTPADPGVVYAPADGTLIGVDEVYEHRFLHTDAVRLAIEVTPFDVPVQRAPVSGTITYLERVAGAYRPIWDLRDSEQNDRQYLGISTGWGPVLLVLVAGPLARRISCRPLIGETLTAGDRLSTMRLGARVDLLLPSAAVDGLPSPGAQLRAGITRVGVVGA